MAIETDEDLDALFHPDDFGKPMTAFIGGVAVPFVGIPTTGYTPDLQHASSPLTAGVSMMVPRIIAKLAALPGLAQQDEIEMPGGKRVVVNDVHYKGDLIIIHYHEHW